MKVVINTCHGGFALSEEGFEYLIKKRGWKTTTWDDNGKLVDKSAPIIKTEGRYGFQDKYYFNSELTDNNKKKFRTHPDLVEVVEKLGYRANTSLSSLKVVNVPDDVEWYIEEYDGAEWIAEEHRTWS